jgi:tetratricopeptide (TPR) repeat protein
MAFWSGFRRLGKHRDYQRGIMHYNRGEFAEAASAFEAALAAMSDPADPQYSLGAFYAAEARANLGLARFQAGDDARAEEDFRKALEKNPHYPDLHYYVALLCERTGRPGEASAALETALSIHPDYLEARLLFAVVLAQLGDAARARAELERCVALGFELPPGLTLDHKAPFGPLEWQALKARATRRSEAARQVATAVEREGQGRREDAIVALRAAADAEPKFADVRCRLAALLADAGLYEEARAELLVALTINPRYVEARTRLGLALLFLGRPLEADSEFATVLAQAPEDADVHYFRAAARFAIGDLDAADQALDCALLKQPRLARAHRLRGLCLVARGRHDEALAALARALEDGRELPAAAVDLGVLLLERGKAREAQKSFERASALAAGHAGRPLRPGPGAGRGGGHRGRERAARALPRARRELRAGALPPGADAAPEGQGRRGPPPARGARSPSCRTGPTCAAPSARPARSWAISKAPRPPIARRSSSIPTSPTPAWRSPACSRAAARPRRARSSARHAPTTRFTRGHGRSTTAASRSCSRKALPRLHTRTCGGPPCSNTTRWCARCARWRPSTCCSRPPAWARPTGLQPLDEFPVRGKDSRVSGALRAGPPLPHP